MGKNGDEELTTNQAVQGQAVNLPSKPENNSSQKTDWPSSIIEASEEAIFSVDLNWYFTYVNSYAALLFGRSAESLLDKSLWEEFPTLRDSNFGKFYRRVMAEGQKGFLEDFSSTSQSWYEVRAYPVAQGLVVYFRDINARKQVELHLRESEERYRILSESSFEGVVLHRQGEVIMANQSLARMLGYDKAEDLIGVKLAQHLTPEALTDAQAYLPQSDTSDHVEGRMIRKDGTTFLTEGRSKEVEYRGQPARVGVIKDISERKLSEQQFKESEARFRMLSEAIFEGVLVHDNRVIVEANQLAAEMLGYSSPAELHGTEIEHYLTPETLAELQRRIAEGSEEIYEGMAVRRDGSVFPVEAHAKAAEYNGQRVRIKVLKDITERKQAEETLRKTQAQLIQAQKMESIGRLAGGIAHDFNNILTAISGYTELILMSLDEQEPLYGDVMEIQKATERATNLTRQLLIFSRQQITQPRRLNLNNIVTELDKMLRRLIGEDIDLKSLLEPDLEEILVDPAQIEQVIVNLAVNARDAMPEGGKLTIETANVVLDESYRAAHYPHVKTGAYVMLAVSDTGHGMDRATQEKIFEPFFTTKEAGKGTGLGLATVYGIVQNSEGHIMVYSEPGLGTSFKIYFPILKKALPMLGQPILTTAINIAAPDLVLSGGQGQTVLVIEDDNLVRELIERVLREVGYKVLSAADGQEALELVERYGTGIDLVLTDIVMPRMGGAELIRRLKRDWPDLRLVCMSGYTERASQQHAILQQCDYFLQKPFTPSALLNQLKKALV
jgi:PAS domain S-box-containing protein